MHTSPALAQAAAARRARRADLGGEDGQHGGRRQRRPRLHQHLQARLGVRAQDPPAQASGKPHPCRAFGVMVHTRSETAPTSCVRAQRCSQSRAESSLCHDLQAAMHTAASVHDNPLRPADPPLRPRPGALLLRHAGRAGAASAAAAAQPLRRRLRERAAHCACAWMRSMCCAPTDTRYLTAAQTPVRPASSAAAPRGGTSSSSGACPQGRHLAARGIA